MGSWGFELAVLTLGSEAGKNLGWKDRSQGGAHGWAAKGDISGGAGNRTC